MTVKHALNILGANSGVTREQRRHALSMVERILQLQRDRIRYLQDDGQAAKIRDLQRQLCIAHRQERNTKRERSERQTHIYKLAIELDAERERRRTLERFISSYLTKAEVGNTR